MGWFKNLLIKLYLVERPPASRKREDRRRNERRWMGPEGEKPKAVRDPRRKKERRRKGRRG